MLAYKERQLKLIARTKPQTNQNNKKKTTLNAATNEATTKK